MHSWPAFTILRCAFSTFCSDGCGVYSSDSRASYCSIVINTKLTSLILMMMMQWRYVASSVVVKYCTQWCSQGQNLASRTRWLTVLQLKTCHKRQDYCATVKHTLVWYLQSYEAEYISTVLCQKALSAIFCHFSLFYGLWHNIQLCICCKIFVVSCTPK